MEGLVGMVRFRRRKPALTLVPDFPVKHVRVLRGGDAASDNGGSTRAPLLSTPEWKPLPSVDEIDRIFDRYEDAVSELARASARLERTLEEISRGVA